MWKYLPMVYKDSADGQFREFQYWIMTFTYANYLVAFSHAAKLMEKEGSQW